MIYPFLSLLQVSLLTVTLVYYVYYIYHSVIILEVAELLQRHNHRGHVDVGVLATWEQVREGKGRMKAGQGETGKLIFNVARTHLLHILLTFMWNIKQDTLYERFIVCFLNVPLLKDEFTQK